MNASIKIGMKLISPKRAKDKKGTTGIFLTEREWKTVLRELKIKTPALKKESVLAGTLTAIEEVEQYLQGKKRLRNAKDAIGEL